MKNRTGFVSAVWPGNPLSCPRGHDSGVFLELALDLVRDDGREQRDALDESGEDQCRGLNAARRFGLARHSFGCAATDTADADAGADDGEAAADTSADEAEPPAVARRLGGYLEQGVHGHGTLRTVEDRTTHRPAPLGAARHRGPGLNELLRPFGRIPLSRWSAC